MKSCPDCARKELAKIAGRRNYIFDLNRMAYSTTYHSSCGVYLYCKLCTGMFKASSSTLGASEWDYHMYVAHQNVTITAASLQENDRIKFIGARGDHLMYNSVGGKLYIVFPQLLSITAINRHVYYIANQSEMELEDMVFADVQGNDYICRLCSQEYDSFPTLKMVHRHFKYCLIASQLAAC